MLQQTQVEMHNWCTTNLHFGDFCSKVMTWISNIHLDLFMAQHSMTTCMVQSCEHTYRHNIVELSKIMRQWNFLQWKFLLPTDLFFHHTIGVTCNPTNLLLTWNTWIQSSQVY
jgi:hypothetical protein